MQNPQPSAATNPAAKRGGLFAIFDPTPHAEKKTTDPAEVAQGYKHWQGRVLFFATFSYAMFYLVRKNFTTVQLDIGNALHISATNVGWLLTIHGVVYGISKFVNGFFADRSNASVFMGTALIASALLNIWFGFSSTLWILIMIWAFNGWFQGMGFPPCARLMTNWFPPKQLATKFSIWNSSHNIGSVAILLLCGLLAWLKLSWRACFFVPAAIVLGAAVLVLCFLPDSPPSVGLPEVEGTHSDSAEFESQAHFKAFVRKQVFGNKYIWMLSAANFFVYALRFAVFDWGTRLLKETKHIEITHSVWMVSGFEVFGFMGAMLGGWLSDKYLGGRTARACAVYMALAGVSIFAFWKVQTHSELVMTGLLCSTGFFIYGPQCLLAIACANLATKRAAATAVGLTSIFGYASTTLSGWGMGKVRDLYGWNVNYQILIGCAVAGTLLFILAWPADADGYKK